MEMAGIPTATRMKSIEFINLHSFYKHGLPYMGKVTPMGPFSAENTS